MCIYFLISGQIPGNKCIFATIMKRIMELLSFNKYLSRISANIQPHHR